MTFEIILFGALVVTGFFVLWNRWVRIPSYERRGRMVDKDPLLIEYSKAFFPIILVVFVLRSFVVEPFRIPSGSMLPSLFVGDFILVNKFSYGIRLPIVNKKVLDLGDPDHGDVMVFRFPSDDKINYIKRVIGLPGDVVEYSAKQLFINGEKVETEDEGVFTYSSSANPLTFKRYAETLDEDTHNILKDPSRPSMNFKVEVPAGKYFVMGDNRDRSNDSRYWGFVPEENIIGRAFFIWFSWDLANDSSINWERIGDVIR